MARENFFELLELSIDPPEIDQNIIVEALQRKRTEWTELLKHPANSAEVKKYIDLIPEIRRVMFDPGLRQKEARDAGGPRKRKDETNRRQVKDTIGNNDQKIVGKSKLSEKSFEKNNVDTDVDVTGPDGEIRSDYIERLTKSVTKYGLDPDEVKDSIKEYCRKNNLFIENASRRKGFKTPLPVVIITALILAVGAGISARMIQSNGGKREYQALLIQVENQPNMSKKIKILRDYIDSHKQSEFAVDAVTKTKEIRRIIEEEDFSTIVGEAKKWIQINNFNKAREVYSTYLARYPNGKHRDEINTLISNTSEVYYICLKRDLISYQYQEDWQKCIHLCNDYIDRYGDGRHFKEVQQMQRIFKKKLQDKIIHANLIKSVRNQGTDYIAARQILSDYLQAHPDTSLKEDLQHELTRLAKLARRKHRQQIKDKIKFLLNQTEGRFIEKEENTISDTGTGLMWTMMDSGLDLGICLNYESAKKYVDNLRTGDYSDWRLPSTRELEEIYKKEPSFPSWERKWFWSSNQFKRYSEGWRVGIDIVTSKKEALRIRQQADSLECGTVHAVRP